MADRARIGSFTNGRFVTELDVNDGTTYAFQRDTFKIGPPPPKQIVASADRRYGGGKVVGETHDNGSIEAVWYVGGGGVANTAINNAETLLTSLTSPTAGRYIEWRPENATRSVYYEIAGPATGWEPQWKWIEWQAQKMIAVHGAVSVSPLAIGDPMDTYDPWTANFLSDYTFDSAAATDVSSSGGQLTPVVGASLATERRFTHTAKGYNVVESQGFAPFTVGATLTGFKFGIILQRTGPNDYLEAYVDDDGTNSRVRIDKVVGGVRTNFNTANLGTRLVAGQTYWFQGRREGPMVQAEFFLNYPSVIYSPADGKVSYALTTAEQATFAAGGSTGVSWVPQGAGASVGALRIEPFTYYGLNASSPGVTPQPQPITVNGIPGTAQAQADVKMAVNGFLPAQFGLVAWAPTPAAINMVTNGDFEDDIDGWTGNSSILTNGGAVVSSYASGAKFGIRALNVATTGAFANQGASFRVYGVFRRGVTYTYSAWVKATSGTQQAQVAISPASFGADSAGSALTALTTGYQQLTGTWTPSSDRTDVVVAVRIFATVAQTFQVDGVQVYRGTTPPASFPQVEGRGASPTFGPINAASFDASASTGMSVQTASGGGSLSGDVARWTVGSQGVASYWIDPSLIQADTFSGTDQRVEIWARAYVPSTLTKLTIAASSKSASGVGTERFTGEFGNAGKQCILPSSSTVWRHYRLGTLVLNADPQNAHRYKLTLYLNAGAASTGNVELDYILLVPVQARASSPSGKASDSGYPTFFGGTVGHKIIKSNLVGASQFDQFSPPLPDHGLGGQLIELPPGSVDFMATVFGMVPDDPVLSGASEGGPSNKIPFHLAVTPRYFLARGT